MPGPGDVAGGVAPSPDGSPRESEPVLVELPRLPEVHGQQDRMDRLIREHGFTPVLGVWSRLWSTPCRSCGSRRNAGSTAC